MGWEQLKTVQKLAWKSPRVWSLTFTLNPLFILRPYLLVSSLTLVIDDSTMTVILYDDIMINIFEDFMMILRCQVGEHRWPRRNALGKNIWTQKYPVDYRHLYLIETLIVKQAGYLQDVSPEPGGHAKHEHPPSVSAKRPYSVGVCFSLPGRCSSLKPSLVVEFLSKMIYSERDAGHNDKIAFNARSSNILNQSDARHQNLTLLYPSDLMFMWAQR